MSVTMDTLVNYNTTDGQGEAVCYQDGVSDRNVVNIPGLVVIVLFYVVMVILGVTVAWKRRSRTSVDYIIAGRKIGLTVGIITLTATWVGGGYINGTAEKIFTPGYGYGAVWAQAPVCASLGVVTGGLLFARRMREAEYVTMLDPFLQRYGEVTTALLFVMACLANIFYAAAVFSALGATLTVVTGLKYSVAVAVSVSVTAVYTLFGGLASVAYTDVLQLACMIVGTWLAVPFAMRHPAVRPLSETADSWLGHVEGGIWPWFYLDTALAIILGGIPWQDYFQRVLSQKTPRRAVICSVVGGFACIIVAIPAYILGGIAASTDWNATGYSQYGTIPVPQCDRKLALPLVLQYLTPTPVAVIGLGAISAAVMSSADSSILSPGSLFSYNIYRPLRTALGHKCAAKEVSERELLWVMRICVILMGMAAALVAILSDTIYGLWYLSHDIGYFVLFPQLLALIYVPGCNTYGALVSMATTLFLKFSAGDPMLKIPALVKYPYYDEATNTQLFPYRTMSMLIGVVVIVTVSMLTNWLVKSGRMISRDFTRVETESPSREIVETKGVYILSDRN